MDRFIAGMYMRDADRVSATRAARKLPEILRFVDGAHSNAFLDYWRDKRKKAVARAWDEAQREGKSQSERVEFIENTLGISDPRTIRRHAKEGRGEGGSRTRTKKRKPLPDKPA